MITMYKTPALIALVSAALFTQVLPATATTNLVEIKIDGTLHLEDSGNPNYSQVALTFKIKCDPSLGSISLIGFISQPQAPYSNGFTTITCSGSSEKAIIHVQSNYGTLYDTAKSATATVTRFSDGASRTVTLVA